MMESIEVFKDVTKKKLTVSTESGFQSSPGNEEKTTLLSHH